jgi:UrcA family protein
MMRKILCFALCGLFASVAWSDADFSFPYSAQDLGSAEGMARLEKKLETLVRQHCRKLHEVPDVRGLQACERRLTDLTLREMDSPRFTAWIARNSGQVRSG